MRNTKENLNELGKIIGNEAKRNAFKYFYTKIIELENAFLKISWVIFVIGFFCSPK